MADDFSSFSIPGLENIPNFFNFDFNWDWSGIGEYYANPHNVERDMAALDAGLAASPLLKMSPEDQTNFFKSYIDGDPEAIAQDKQMAAVTQQAQTQAKESYNQSVKDKSPQPGSAWVWDNNLLIWTKPPKPSGNYVWDDNKGWIKVTEPNTNQSSTSNISSSASTSGPTVSPTVTTVNNTPTIRQVDPTPSIPLGTSLITTPPPPVKTAPIDTILFNDDAVPIELMTDLIFEDIGGHELINIARNDTVNGQTVSYQPIKNLTTIQQQYNPNNIVSLQNTSDRYFSNFPIKLETKLLNEGEGGGPNGSYVYIEDLTGDLIVELINLEPDEQIEVQISLSGTIYEAEFNES